jgi:hypothetical protein
MAFFDRFEKLAQEAPFSACLFGNWETQEFGVLVNVDKKLRLREFADYHQRDMRFLGVVGVWGKDGAPRMNFEWNGIELPEALQKLAEDAITPHIEAAQSLIARMGRPDTHVN